MEKLIYMPLLQSKKKIIVKQILQSVHMAS